MFILHLVKNSQILVNEDRSICLPIVGDKINPFVSLQSFDQVK